MVWVEITGLPFCAWTEKSFKKIVTHWSDIMFTKVKIREFVGWSPSIQKGEEYEDEDNNGDESEEVISSQGNESEAVLNMHVEDGPELKMMEVVKSPNNLGEEVKLEKRGGSVTL
ncbi:hypothetical protein L1987_15473 [Smallanthus sonchifolius]|uniref:Uncharacterized protein n=1 Tax=Smallanthus sonchifolius TaxID=185202 RepID=A0ACB9J7W1_9ASTR|nr:hypothetical protein L1987_15473 [Smallanthus sonchifolius]